MTKIIPATWLKMMSKEDREAFGKAGLTEEEAYAKFADREEKHLHKLIYAELTRRGVVVIHSRMDRKSTTRVGIPDFCFCYDGLPFAIEVKTPTGKVSQEQKTTMLQMRENGWYALVVRTFDEFLAIL